MKMDLKHIVAAIRHCGRVKALKQGKSFHSHLIKTGYSHNIYIACNLVSMYVDFTFLIDAYKLFDEMPVEKHRHLDHYGFCVYQKRKASRSNRTIYSDEGLVEEAVSLFDQMPDRNVVSWNTVIAGFAENGSSRALQFVCKMHREGIKLDKFTFPCALKTCSYAGFLVAGKQIHCYVLKSGLECSCFAVSALVDMYSNCNGLDDAIRLFDHYSGGTGSICDSIVLWNSMLSGALKVCINLLNVRLGTQVHALIVISGHELDYVVGSILVDLYAKLGNMKDAFELFHRLPKKDIVAWSGLLMGCTKMELNSLALSLFRDMVTSGAEVDQYMVSNVLKVCSSLASIGTGKQVHAFCIKRGYETEQVTITALIDMYSKCGEVEDGLVLFGCVADRDVVCWTGIIVGCAQNGRAMEALEIFRQMVQSGLKPNEVTYLGILDLVSTIAENLLANFPNDSSIYVMLSNAYGTLGMWDSLSQVREAAKKLGVKAAGTSWIEISS
ncbi:hypothetical protein OIU85_021254 [Salix viminalis]|uniref:Pentatricopeptide repeat-containing protein n=1 Tax=Salix viminalis TaxID=40686 RepID=A0A9Q0ZDE5_SALVM|nr:hypothetical protein OIU85_021254 [Salix viminalis]